MKLVPRGSGRGVLLVVALIVAAACSAAPRPGTDVAAGDARDDRTYQPRQVEGGIDVDGDGVADTAADGTPLPGTPGGTAAGATAPGGTPAPGTPGAPGPAAPGPTVSGPAPWVSTLFSEKEDRVGISDSAIRMCAHAALTYGAAFNTSDDDLNVYWSAVNDAGGIHNRRVDVTYENDNYSPDTAVQAATACEAKGIFMLLGGIGFDQIPAVREHVESRRLLYFHHTATVNGSEGKRFSYTGLPTTEKMGEMFAELALARYRGKKVAIIKRDSANWEPGVDGFKRLAAQHGIPIAFERGVQVNKRQYLQDILDAEASGAEVVWLWLNALESTEFIKQTKAQDWHPHFMVFPFNVMSQTLGDDALNPPVTGVAMFNAYSKGDYSGEFARYADDMKQFEAQYAKYRPNVDLNGLGGDLLFLNWSAQKAMHRLLEQCGRDCTRNRFLEVLHGFKASTNSSACELDFTRPGPDNDHRGGWAVSIMEAYRSPSGKVNFRNTATCVEHII